MRIGIIELLSGEATGRWDHRAYGYMILKQYASIMPQAVSVWCRELGHQVFYATYFGQKDPRRLLPNDLDVVFISSYTQASPLAYALAKLYRREKTLTVLGGPHAKQFSDDSLRFFDVVVQECNKALIAGILSDMPRGEIISSGRTLQYLPGIQERMPEIRTSNFWRGNTFPFAIIPVLTSLGCPYSCDFCIDWNNPYVLLPLEQQEADLRFIIENYPDALVTINDPNFAVEFDKVLAMLERLPRRGRRWYMIESSLSILRVSRLERLRDTGCYLVAPGVESWAAYSNKSGRFDNGFKAIGRQKLDQVVEHFKLINECIPVILTNFLFGLDTDEGKEPVELTKEFMTRVPFVIPNVNIPTPFGGTPLYDRYLEEGRILASMPFAFYYTPYLVTTLKNYSPVTYYENLIEIFQHMTSMHMLLKKLKTTSGKVRFVYNPLKTLAVRQMTGACRQILHLLITDDRFREFHEGRCQTLPEFYHHLYERSLGPYAGLLSREDRQPTLVPTREAVRRHCGRDDRIESLVTL